MTDRIAKLKKEFDDNYYNIPISIEKIKYVTEALKNNDGYHNIIKLLDGTLPHEETAN